MAYIKQTWETGDIITADKLNHIEDGIENNNPGYEITESEQLILDETVTIADGGTAFLQYSEFINYPTITVDFNGDIYECELIKDQNPQLNAYGGVGSSGPDFTEYPFAIVSSAAAEMQYNILYVKNSDGDYSVKIYAKESTINRQKILKKVWQK